MNKILPIFFRYLKVHEKTFFLSIFLILIFFIIKTFSEYYTIEIPKDGGILHEVVVENNPIKHINPVLANNQAEKDLSSLIYSSLMKIDPETGKLVKDLGEYTVSEDGLEYTFRIDKDKYFQDGVKVTSDDIIFTIETIQNPSINSPLYPNWVNVEIKKVDDFTVKFILKKKYNQFSNFFTVGILPKHLLSEFTPKRFKEDTYNLEPVGSGKYIFSNRNKTENEDRYYLFANPKLTHKPHISEIIYHSFYNLSSFEKSSLFNNTSKVINISSVYPKTIPQIKEYNLYWIKIPKIIFLFFNLNDKKLFLTDNNVRLAISKAISRDQIVDLALNSNAILANTFRPWLDEEILPEKREKLISEASLAIEKSGWEKNKEGFFEKNDKIANLEIDIINYDEFITVAKNIAKNLEEIGIKSTIIKHTLADYSNRVISKKEFQSTIFGYDTYLNPDIYFFLGSDFENPINISNYFSSEVTKLSKNIRTTKTIEETEKLYQKLENLVFNKDIPLIPLYSPNFTYITSKKLTMPMETMLNDKSGRFNNIEKWYINTEKILPFFKTK